MSLLQVESLCVQNGRAKILSDVGLSLSKGKLVALIGPNGAGKSTLLKTLCGLQPLASGRILWAEEDLDFKRRRFVSTLISYLPQDRYVEWDLTCMSVVALGRLPHQGYLQRAGADCESIVLRCLDKVGAIALAARKFRTLSGGEKAKILLARALAVEASIVLADEPEAGLDAGSAIQTMKLLQSTARRGALVLTALHDLTLAVRYADEIILLSDGRVKFTGTPDALLKSELVQDTYNISTIQGVHKHQNWVLPWDNT